jgi:hypothetical protein
MTTRDLPLCVECARAFLREEPPSDMPAPGSFRLGPKGPTPSSAAADVFDPQGWETCRAIGCMGTGERCPRCKRKLPAAIREANGVSARLNAESEDLRRRTLELVESVGRRG